MTQSNYRGPDSRQVQAMFARIAPRYDFLNHFLSASVDRHWRNLAVQKIRQLTRGAPPRLCLDVCSGTGDLAAALQRGLGCDVVASDFCHPMLTRAKLKFAGKRVINVEADALGLPFPAQAFDVLTIAFGLRNLEDPLRGLQEMRRVLKPGGVLIILEFSKPVMPILKQIFRVYFQYILPRFGALISGDSLAYRYLPDSVQKFPSQDQLLDLLRAAGFRNPEYRNLSGGIAALHWAET